MDDLYDNLDNYNEENTIAELQSENKELKLKLEDYASTLETLQKDFDKVSSEYKILEKNYSSLLKTAKAEIERKTQIITNLNLEKDKMVLKSYQNRNVSFVNRRPYDEPKRDRDSKLEKDGKRKVVDSGTKNSSHPAADRKESGYPSKDITAPKTDIRNKLLDMANSGAKPAAPRIEKNNDVKENVIQPKNDSDNNMSRSSDPVRNRRKSIPAASIQMEKFSTDDDDLASSGSYKDLSKEHTDTRHVDHKSRERSSRISETSCLEDRKYGYNEPLSDARKSRTFSRYDNERNDRYRTRDKSSHRLNRHSPDRNRRGPKDIHDDPYHRSEPDRQRAIESTTADKYHWRRSREAHQNNKERNQHEHERLHHRSQEKYAVKHKIPNSHDKSDNKKMKMELDYRQSVEDQRLQDERDFLEKQYLGESNTFPNNVKFSSCESPDYNHPVISTQQIREIKVTATTKLDDPRTSNKKYIVQKDDGKLAFSTAEGRNVDIVPLNPTAWTIKPANLPKALIRRPSVDNVKEMQMEIENPVANLSIESGEICDLEGLESECQAQEVNKNRVLESDGRDKHVKTINEPKNSENSSQKLNSYKIPKRKKKVDERPSRKYTKESTLLEKAVIENVPGDKSKNYECFIKTSVENKPIKPEKRLETVLIPNNNEMPFLGSDDLYDKQECGTAKEVVEGDLELSDDNCDNNEITDNVAKEKVTFSRLEKDKKYEDQSCSFKTIKHSSNALEPYEVNVKCNKRGNKSGETKHERAVELCKDKVTDDGKKSKNKKKIKHKESKESEPKDLAQILETRKKKEKEKESKTNQIKTKFCELFDDSSSLIYPEDLGLTAVPTSTTLLPGKCVPFIEDAQDAADLTTKKNFTHSKDTIDEESQYNQIKIDTIINRDSEEKKDDVQPAISKDVTEIMYKNLEPDNLEKETNVKTVIISTGVQPPMSFKSQELAHKTNPQVKAIQEVSLQALATSTPHKTLPNVVQPDAQTKLPDTSCNSNDSLMVSVVNTPALNISDTNTLDSQTNDSNVPDVRIFVKRRRKLIKK